jgi:hypothetical protein
MAAAQAVTENIDAAFHWLSRSITMGNENRRWIDIDPVWDPYRDDSRFLTAMAGRAATGTSAGRS